VHKAPQDVQLRVRRAEARRRGGHPRDALADVRIAARLEARSGTTSEAVVFEHALVLSDLGRNAKARELLGQLLDDGEGSASVFTARAELNRDALDWEAARADFDAAIALEPTPLRLLARYAVDAAREAPDDAAEGLREGLEAMGPAVVVQLALVEAERARQHHDAALAELDVLLADSPRRADWRLLRADVLSDAGQHARAAVERVHGLWVAQGAVHRRPTPLHQITLARTWLAVGNPEAAAEALSPALRTSPNLPETQRVALAIRTATDKGVLR
jgi:predicted Zn-dependent protease